MALFSRKTTKTTETKADATPVVSTAGLPQSVAHVLHNPRITEKASMAMEGFVYTFDVASDSNKKQIMAAVKAVYKVTPRKVAIVNVKPKAMRNMRTGKKGMRGGVKKAYVFLNKGETITIA
jgi:ribosomal protein L23